MADWKKYSEENKAKRQQAQVITLVYVSTLLILIVWSIVKAYYYQPQFDSKLPTELSWFLSFSIGVGVLLSRFALLIKSVYDFKIGQIWSGRIGLFASFAFCAYDVYEAYHIGNFFESNALQNLGMFVMSAILVLEYTIALSIVGTRKKEEKASVTNITKPVSKAAIKSNTKPVSSLAVTKSKTNTKSSNGAPTFKCVWKDGKERHYTLQRIQSMKSANKSHMKKAEEKEDFEGAAHYKSKMEECEEFERQAKQSLAEVK